MGTCYTCKQTIALGGIKAHGFRFCSKACHAQKASFLERLAAIPQQEVEIEAARMRTEGRCARCGCSRGVEVHHALFVWSVILVTFTRKNTITACIACARKQQALWTIGTLLAGWWGIPFGLIMTPVATITNVVHLIRSHTRSKPSAALKEYVRERLVYGARTGTAGFADAGGRIEPVA
ncbi:hypothetical protein QLQ15_11655 [Lysobacter sp. LF1]|uniref:Uncharacterized protein n=1 Tax=Lysobacter stagni TaxID=3045172 RepID=A0ABT6XHC3_9GAMM|nr:hypothetical protein [Lysobacter sp. LF1]MDI9239559.1 hypothetical protein [Lysobacter sp. LF1]